MKLPRGGGVLGMAPSTCAASTHLSCFPSFIDAVAEEKGVAKIISMCGNEVRTVTDLCGKPTGKRGHFPPLLEGGRERAAAQPLHAFPLLLTSTNANPPSR